jgi:aspartate aminotransferase
MTVASEALMVSKMAAELKGSEIIKLAGEINDLLNKGEKIFNFTIGDFDPNLFPIPEGLKNEIIKAYQDNQTNYPAANGILQLRNILAEFTANDMDLHYKTNEFLVAGGARPLIYALFQTIVDPGDKVIYPVPSWNNNHYTHLSAGIGIELETSAENNFMPTVDELLPYLNDATLLTLCSPLNPTGTTFSSNQLLKIAEAVLMENKKREVENRKPLYLMYDQIYRTLTYGAIEHYNPVSFFEELKPYTIFIDGLSKAFAATGVRVGWAFGPENIISKMSNILGHVGAWAPKPEQVATAHYLKNDEQVEHDLKDLKAQLSERLNQFYEGFQKLKREGFPVDAIEPQAALYLTIKIDLIGKVKKDGQIIKTITDTTSYLLSEAKLAIVPFTAFGASSDTVWYRLSIGTSKLNEIDQVFLNLKQALTQLS